VIPDVEVILESKLSADSNYRADMILKKDDEELIVELKRFRGKRGLDAGRDQLERYLEVSGINHGLLVFVPDTPSELEVLDFQPTLGSKRIGILVPKRESGGN